MQGVSYCHLLAYWQEVAGASPRPKRIADPRGGRRSSCNDLVDQVTRDLLVFLGCAFLLGVALLIPREQPRTFEAEAGQAVAEVMTTELPICPALSDGQWLRYGILHCPDSAPLWACERSCLYGYPPSARFIQ